MVVYTLETAGHIFTLLVGVLQFPEDCPSLMAKPAPPVLMLSGCWQGCLLSRRRLQVPEV